MAKTLKNALLWDVLSISFHLKHQFPKISTYKGFSHRGHFSFYHCEPPFSIPIVGTYAQQRHITGQLSIISVCSVFTFVAGWAIQLCIDQWPVPYMVCTCRHLMSNISPMVHKHPSSLHGIIYLSNWKKRD